MADEIGFIEQVKDLRRKGFSFVEQRERDLIAQPINHAMEISVVDWCENHKLYQLKSNSLRVKRNINEDQNYQYRSKKSRSFGQTQSQLLRSRSCNGQECNDKDEARASASNGLTESVVSKKSNYILIKSKL